MTDKKLRKSIIHAHDVTYQQLKDFLAKPVLRGWFTEKTDGFAWEFGIDEKGFFTRTSNSPKIRKSGGYADLAFNTFGVETKFDIAMKFDHLHGLFENHTDLMKYLRWCNRGFPASIQGEMFYRADGKLDDGCLRFVKIKYDDSAIGIIGTFVVHSRLPANRIHNLDLLKEFSTNIMKIDHDALAGPFMIDVEEEKVSFESLNHLALTSRKLRARYIKEAEMLRLNMLRFAFSSKLRRTIENRPFKWGKETEGHVFHPEMPFLPRLKIISDTFRNRRHEWQPQILGAEPNDPSITMEDNDNDTISIARSDKRLRADPKLVEPETDISSTGTVD